MSRRAVTSRPAADSTGEAGDSSYVDPPDERGNQWFAEVCEKSNESSARGTGSASLSSSWSAGDSLRGLQEVSPWWRLFRSTVRSFRDGRDGRRDPTASGVLPPA